MFSACFSSFLFKESPQKRPNAVRRQIWQDVGPDYGKDVSVSFTDIHPGVFPRGPKN